jgi:predicted nuclease of predicted toxin-antitoxin system
VNSSFKNPIRLLLDQGIPRDTAVILRDNGYDCVHVGEIGMTRAEDDQFLAWARHHFCMAVTVDAEIRLIESPASGIGGPRILRFYKYSTARGRNLNGPNAAELIHRMVSGGSR